MWLQPQLINAIPTIVYSAVSMTPLKPMRRKESLAGSSQTWGFLHMEEEASNLGGHLYNLDNNQPYRLADAAEGRAEMVRNKSPQGPQGLMDQTMPEAGFPLALLVMQGNNPF